MQYSAPEDYTGKAAGRASDLYALGAIACEMLTGQLPYRMQVARAGHIGTSFD